MLYVATLPSPNGSGTLPCLLFPLGVGLFGLCSYSVAGRLMRPTAIATISTPPRLSARWRATSLGRAAPAERSRRQ
jgi:hypothetical protein